MTLSSPRSLRGRFLAGISAPAVLFAASTLPAQTAANLPIRIVRTGVGNLEGLKLSISAASEACRVIRQLPPQPAALPSDE